MIHRLLLIIAFLIALPDSAEARWREASSRHFVIYSEQSEADLRRFAEQLERFDRALRLQLRRPDPDRSPATRLTIYMMQDIEELQRFFGSESLGGIYFARFTGSVSFTFQPGRRGRSFRGDFTPQVVLFHEYTHHFLYNNFAFGAPLWFSEGYPEFWSTVEFTEDGSVKIGLPAMHRNNTLMFGRPMRAEELLSLRMPMTDGEAYSLAYAKGWLLSHYLSFAENRRGQLDAYLRVLGEGRSPAEAARAFGDLGQLDRDLRNHLTAPRFTFAVIPAAQVQPGPVEIRELRDGEEAIMRVRMRSDRGVDADGADALVPTARRAAAPYPNDAAVQVALAEAEFDADNFAEAEAAADRAIAAAPRSVEAHVFKARAIWGRLAAAGNATAAQWREVQRWLMLANRIDPDDPEPLALFYRSFAPARMRMTANAVAGLLYAQELAPEDRLLRLTAGRQLLVDGNAARARAMLAPFAGDSHAGVIGRQVAEVMTILATGDTRAALARLETAMSENERERERRRRR